jgi:hypothetical protein
MLKFSGQSRSSEVVDRNEPIHELIFNDQQYELARMSCNRLGAAPFRVRWLKCKHSVVECYDVFINCRPSGERGSRNTRSRHLRSSYCCSVYPAVRNSYRALLRSSSIREPSDPPLRVIKRIYILLHVSHFKLYYFLNKLLVWGDAVSVVQNPYGPQLSRRFNSCPTCVGNRAPQYALVPGITLWIA